jgi:hypothetical protein
MGGIEQHIIKGRLKIFKRPWDF